MHEIQKIAFPENMVTVSIHTKRLALIILVLPTPHNTNNHQIPFSAHSCMHYCLFRHIYLHTRSIHTYADTLTHLLNC